LPSELHRHLAAVIQVSPHETPQMADLPLVFFFAVGLNRSVTFFQPTVHAHMQVMYIQLYMQLPVVQMEIECNIKKQQQHYNTDNSKCAFFSLEFSPK
jgi:hypothetical protein